MLSVPTIISGGEHNFRSLANGDLLESCMMSENFPVAIRLELHS